MKGALAAMVHAAAGVDRRRMKGRVVVSASPMEEVLEGTALQEVMRRYPPDFVVIGEATDLNLARGGRGRAEVHLETLGIPAHSSAPHLGRNAALDMMKVPDDTRTFIEDSGIELVVERTPGAVKTFNRFQGEDKDVAIAMHLTC